MRSDSIAKGLARVAGCCTLLVATASVAQQGTGAEGASSKAAQLTQGPAKGDGVQPAVKGSPTEKQGRQGHADAAGGHGNPTQFPGAHRRSADSALAEYRWQCARERRNGTRGRGPVLRAEGGHARDRDGEHQADLGIRGWVRDSRWIPTSALRSAWPAMQRAGARREVDPHRIDRGWRGGRPGDLGRPHFGRAGRRSPGRWRVGWPCWHCHAREGPHERNGQPELDVVTGTACVEMNSTDPNGLVTFLTLGFLLVFAPLFQGGNRPVPLLVLELAAITGIAALAWHGFSRVHFRPLPAGVALGRRASHRRAPAATRSIARRPVVAASRPWTLFSRARVRRGRGRARPDGR